MLCDTRQEVSKFKVRGAATDMAQECAKGVSEAALMSGAHKYLKWALDVYSEASSKLTECLGLGPFDEVEEFRKFSQERCREPEEALTVLHTSYIVLRKLITQINAKAQHAGLGDLQDFIRNCVGQIWTWDTSIPGIGNMNDIFQDLAVLVDEQGHDIDNVEFNVTEAEQRTKDGV